MNVVSLGWWKNASSVDELSGCCFFGGIGGGTGSTLLCQGLLKLNNPWSPKPNFAIASRESFNLDHPKDHSLFGRGLPGNNRNMFPSRWTGGQPWRVLPTLLHADASGRCDVNRMWPHQSLEVLTPLSAMNVFGPTGIGIGGIGILASFQKWIHMASHRNDEWCMSYLSYCCWLFEHIWWVSGS